MTDRLTLAPGFAVALTATGQGWAVTPEHSNGTPCRPGDGAAEALLQLLRADGDLADRWQVLRLAGVPEVSGERAIPVDQTNLSVVVGERVIVKWLRSVTDEAQPSLAALAQLTAVGFSLMPTAYAVLTWTSPTGRALPVAYVSELLPDAEDGWTWCVALVRALAAGDLSDPWAVDLPARVGRLAADLHVALATPNHTFPRPVQPAGASRVQRWHDGAFAMLERALSLSDPEIAGLVTDGAEAMSSCFDQVLGADQELAGTPVQHIHGDLHVGQILRWSEGLAIVDFDGNPVAPTGGGVMHPAARDVAQLVVSLDLVGQVVLHRNPELSAARVRQWLASCRAEFLATYRKTLQDKAMGYLLDERLLPAFELEQQLRELVYAHEHLPDWAFAPLGSLRDRLRDRPPPAG